MKKIKIKQIKSRIGSPKDQKKTLDALGLRRMNRVVEHNATPQILGMVNKVKHLNPNGDIQYISLNSGSFNVESIKNPGLHEFYNDSYLLQSLAVNIEPAELSSRLLTNKEINVLVGHDCYFFRYDDSVSASIINNRQGYELWRYLLWILCFMVISLHVQQ